MKDLLSYDPAKPPPLRISEPPEFLAEMKAHKGVCKYCEFEFVKMPRDPRTGDLLPDKCWCIVCGQRYFMKIENIQVWELLQWKQKMELS